MTTLTPEVVRAFAPVSPTRSPQVVIADFLGSRDGITTHIHGITVDGTSVAARRTDTVSIAGARLNVSFGATGRFTVEDGVVTAWDDEVRFGDVVRGLLRGLRELGRSAEEALNPRPLVPARVQPAPRT